MKKKITILFLFIVSLFFTKINDTYAANTYSAKIINTIPCALYKELKNANATGSCMYTDNKFNNLTNTTFWVDTGDTVTVHTDKAPLTPPKSGHGSECKSEFVYIGIDYKQSTYYGYVCKDFIWDGTISEELKTKFKNAGFPESYYEGLAVMQIAHPNWKFVAIPTGVNFEAALNGEDVSGKSLMQKTGGNNNVGYLSTEEADYNWKTDKYTVYDSSTWYQASRQTIAYYMDPRNWLSDMYVFQFEPISYTEMDDSLTVVQTILKGQFLLKYAQNFVNAAKKADVSAVYLAGLSKQEVGGTTANVAISGKAFSYNGVNYPAGYYNFYNIGASSDAHPAQKGLVYAYGGTKGTDTTYNRPWNSPDKAIYGGALFIHDTYLAYFQNTGYFKKWNVVANYAKSIGSKYYNLYTHQYMTAIIAPSTEAKTAYSSYYSLGLLDSNFTFYIPVYNNMPAKTTLPKKGSPNNYTKTITISKNGATATNLSTDGSKTEYELHVDSKVTKVNIGATLVNSAAKVTGTGEKTLALGDNVWKLVVTAENGTKRTYTINIIKDKAEKAKTATEVIKESDLHIDGNYLTGLTLTTSISSIQSKINKIESTAKVTVKNGNTEVTSGNLVTGEVVTIESGGEKKSYTVVLYGDINGDSKINALDLLKVQKHILGINKLSGTSLKAADVSKDNNVNSIDLLKVQKNILGISFISQE